MKYYLILASLMSLTACVNQNELAYRGSDDPDSNGNEFEFSDFGQANGGFGTGYTPPTQNSEANDLASSGTDF